MIKMPDLIKLNDWGGDWPVYFEEIYSIFKTDFVDSTPIFRGQRIRLKTHPKLDDKEATFWHFITTGDTEEERTPDMRRCERIAWPRFIIDNETNTEINIWENRRKGKRNVCLTTPGWDYILILTYRNGYIIPWTAYHIERNHTKEKLKKEYLKYKKANTAS